MRQAEMEKETDSSSRRGSAAKRNNEDAESTPCRHDPSIALNLRVRETTFGIE